MSTKQPHPEKLILASASPRRRELLTRMGVQFEVMPTGVDEIEDFDEGADVMVLKNAQLKAQFLEDRHPAALILGSDTTVSYAGEALGKPTSDAAAMSMLEMLSGKKHVVYTAVALRWKGLDFSYDFVDSSEVQFKKLDKARIKAYHAVVNPFDKAGAYGIQEGREMIIESVTGSVETVMGLPIQRLKRVFGELGYNFSY